MAGQSNTQFAAAQAAEQKKAQQLQAIASAPQSKPQLLLSEPGITLDGTRFQKQTYIDGHWCRFWQDKPRKMLGYKEQVRQADGVMRNLTLFSTAGYTYVHMGSTATFERYSIELTSGVATTPVDRTPGGYLPNDNNLWQSTTIFQTSGQNNYIFAVATPSLNDITNETSEQVYYGLVTDAAPLQAAVFTIAADPTGIAFAQQVIAAGPLSLGQTAVPFGAGHVTVSTDGNLTALTYTIVGFDAAGAPLTVGPTALPNNATADTGATFSAINSVTISGGTGSNNVSVGWLAGSQNITSSGGVVGVGPYLFLYGADGIIRWSVPGFPLNFVDAGAGAANPVSDKIVRGMPLRGTSAPAAIFWSLSSLIIGNFVGGQTFWNFTTVSTSTSILSSNSVVEHNGVYYWASTSGFHMFSGAMQDIPNDYNQDFWLKNLNYSQRQKAFAFKVPRFKEIWFCGPIGTSTEPNFAVIYRYDKGYWYSTPLPNGGRAAGFYEQTYRFPIMTGVTTNDDTGGTSVWQHEIGVDEVSGSNSTTKAVLSFFQTHELNLVMPSGVGQLGDTHSQSFSVMEPDFNQLGNLIMQVYSRPSPAVPDDQLEQPTDSVYVQYGGYPVPAPSSLPNPADNEVDFKFTSRLTSFVIESNVVGGYYEAGSPLIHWKPDQQRRTG